MQGTGTQADPYICENWEELLSVSTNKNNYIKMADSDSKVIDFNDVQPTGFENTITLAGQIDFNGWKFKNLYSTAQRAIQLQSGTKWENLTLENFSHKCTQQSAITIADGSSDVTTIFENCVFSGIVEHGSNENYFIMSSNYQSLRIERCNFNFSFQSSGKINIFYLKEFSNSEAVIHTVANKCMLLTGRNTSNGISSNSRFVGDITTSANDAIICGYNNSGFSIYNIQSTAPLKYTGSGISIYNSDTCAVSSDSSANIKGVPNDKMNDASYLNSIGFIVGDGT